MPQEETTTEWTQTYKMVPIKLIDTEGQSVRDQQDDDHISELVNSIAKNGLLQPIVARKRFDARYQLVAGFHRLQAAVRLGWDDIPTHIIQNPETPVKALALIENLMRRDLSLDEECKSVAFLTENDKLSPSQICDSLGKSRAWVDRRLAIPHLPDNVRNAVLDGLISLQVAELIGAVEHAGTRGTLLNQSIYGKLTASQVQDLVAIYQANPYLTEPVSPPDKNAPQVEAPQAVGKQCGICGVFQEYRNLRPVWICRAGCRPTNAPDTEQKGEQE